MAGPRSDPETPVLFLELSVGMVAEFLTALEAAGLPSALQEIAILRPEIGVPSAGQVQLDGATIEVYDLGSIASGEDLVNALRGETVVLVGNVGLLGLGPDRRRPHQRARQPRREADHQ